MLVCKNALRRWTSRLPARFSGDSRGPDVPRMYGKTLRGDAKTVESVRPREVVDERTRPAPRRPARRHAFRPTTNLFVSCFSRARGRLGLWYRFGFGRLRYVSRYSVFNYHSRSKSVGAKKKKKIWSLSKNTTQSHASLVKRPRLSLGTPFVRLLSGKRKRVIRSRYSHRYSSLLTIFRIRWFRCTIHHKPSLCIRFRIAISKNNSFTLNP